MTEVQMREAETDPAVESAPRIVKVVSKGTTGEGDETKLRIVREDDDGKIWVTTWTVETNDPDLAGLGEALDEYPSNRKLIKVMRRMEAHMTGAADFMAAHE